MKVALREPHKLLQPFCGKSSHGWHEGQHDVQPWFNHLLSTLRLAYREFEERAGRAKPPRGSKTNLIEAVLEGFTGPFRIGDVEQRCPNVGRDLIRRVMNRWREEGKLEMLSRGRDAQWRRKT